ncbi:MAG: YggS family pyridoxal phosphate-dependent enzyme [Buchnera aphidicola (Periphyllus aceris)]|nr:YggS family pyridoxal phosphate-dependent enzyme [Buchnera aphidicola (Periphyllus aceris)]
MKNLIIKKKIKKIKKNINKISKKIKKISKKKIKLLIITKNQKTSLIKKIISKKYFCLGENYIQEALKKIKKLKKYKYIQWHFVGNIQSNKTKMISKYFQWCHSVKNKKTLLLLNKNRSSKNSPLKILIQITQNEIKNNNVKKISKRIKKLEKIILQLPKLKLKGIMVFPKINKKKINKKIYKKSKKIFNILKKKIKHFDTLSLGTSRDFKKSILYGSTLIRIGTKIFN